MVYSKTRSRLARAGARIRTAAKMAGRSMARKQPYILGASLAYDAYKASRSLPSRVRFSRKRLNQTRNQTYKMSNVSGSKYQGYTNECQNPVGKPAGNQPINYVFMNSGKPLTPLGGSYVNYVPMNLFKFEKGTGNDQRIGDYMYIRHSKLKLEIQALPEEDSVGTLAGSQPVLQFRCMVVKANRKFDKLGENPDPGTSLFLDTQNNGFGYGVPGGQSSSTNFLNMSAPINRREWYVYCDKKFKLSAPALGSNPSGGGARTNNAYPKYNTKKYITLNLPVSKKCHFVNDDTEPEENVPSNLDTQWLLIVQCIHGSYCVNGTRPPENWTMNILGTTSAYDN